MNLPKWLTEIEEKAKSAREFSIQVKHGKVMGGSGVLMNAENIQVREVLSPDPLPYLIAAYKVMWEALEKIKDKTTEDPAQEVYGGWEVKKIKCWFGFHVWGELVFEHCDDQAKHFIKCCEYCGVLRNNRKK